MKWPWFILPLIISILLIAEIFLGSTILNPVEILNALAYGGNDSILTLITEYRIPRIFTAVSAGAALGICGLLLQSLFRNPLAGPSVLGVSSGAGLGSALFLLGTTLLFSRLGLPQPSGTGLFRQLTGSVIGGTAVLFLILVLSKRKGSSLSVLILFGITLGYIASAGIMILAQFSPPEQLQSYMTWTFGAFNQTSGLPLRIMIISVGVLTAVSFSLAKACNLLQMGPEYSRTVGLNYERTAQGILLISALLSGLVTAFCGPVAFIGIAAPHLARMSLRTQDHKLLIPGSMLFGIIAALAADIISLMPGHMKVLPLNAVTALLGGPFLLILILKYRREGGWHL